MLLLAVVRDGATHGYALGRRRRVYSLTATGRRRLSQQCSEWNLFAKTIGSVIGSRT